MKKEGLFRTVLRILNHYFVFFLLVAFVITCCTMLFVSTLRDTTGIVLTSANIGTAAKLTFWNVALLSLIFTVIDTLRRKWTVDRPAKRITDAAEKIMQGDFTVRIEPQSRLAADDAFNRISECFNNMAQELSGVETLRTDFIANVSHEMKTPLAVIQNYGTLLQTPDLEPEKRIEYAKGVTDGSRRLADMMTNILKLNRLDNQQIFPQTAEFDLGEQLCECLLGFEEAWEEKGLEIETEIEQDVIVEGDAQLLSIVWNNLFSNAVKFTAPGGRISLKLAADGEEAVVQLSDTGCGFGSDVGRHIFEKFYQGDSSHATKGNGLGLALVKRVVDLVGGDIAVDSEVGKGSCFTVRIRRKMDAQA